MRPKSWVLAGVAALAVTAGGAVLASTGGQSAHAAQRPQVSTATVQREDLSATTPQDGTLTFAARADGSPYAVINQAKGTYTTLPAVGRVIHQAQVLYRVSGNLVLLLRGSTPAYRTLSAGMTGPDVAELNRDLVALGYATAGQLNPTSSDFRSATANALEKLQAAHRLTQTGMLPLGQAVFEPTDIRVTGVPVLLGGSAQAGEPVLQGTSTTRQVQVALDATQQTDVAVGDKVSIALPNNRTTIGVVSSVGTVATCPPSSGSTGSGSSTASTGTDSCSPGSAPPTINVDVTPSDPAATGRWDQAAVQVGITTARVAHALVVPVNALLARSQGGYAVEVLGAGGRNHLVAVSLGLFDDANGTVQITGSRLAAGQQVVVPTT